MAEDLVGSGRLLNSRAPRRKAVGFSYSRFGRALALLIGALPLVFLALFFVWPVLALVGEGLFGEDSAIDFGGVWAVLSEQRTWQVASQTLTQAALGTVLALLIGVPTGFVLFKLNFRGQGVLRALLTVPFVLPTVVVGAAFTALFNDGAWLGWLRLEQSLVVIVLALAFFNVTVVARTVGGFWAGLDPRPEQAARMLGASTPRVLRTIVLPQLAPAIGAAAALVFLFCATSFGVVLILGGRAYANFETEIYSSAVLFFDLRTAAVLSLLQIALVVLVLWVSSLLRTRSEHAGLKRHGAPVRPLGITPRTLPVVGFVVTALLLIQGLPLVALVARSLRGVDGALSFAHYAALAHPPASTGLNKSVLHAIWLSLNTALVAAALSMLLGLIVVWVLSRRPRSAALVRAQRWYDAAIMLPIGVSAVTLGFGLLLTMRAPLGLPVDLRTSALLVPIAQTVVALPLVIRNLLPAARAIVPAQREAAAMLGASPWRVLRTLDWPLLARPAGLALGFAFAVSLGEFGATSFLVRPESQTLPVVIAQLIGRQGSGNYEMGLAAAVVLGVVTASVMLMAEQFRSKKLATAQLSAW